MKTLSGKLADRNKQKFNEFEQFFLDDHVFIDCSTKYKELQIPFYLKSTSTVTLKLSHLFQGRTYWSEQEGIEVDLVFKGKLHHCEIPWECIWRMTTSSGETTVWPEDTPKELLKEISSLAARKAISVIKNSFKNKKDEDKSLPEEEIQGKMGKEAQEDENKDKKIDRKSILKLIK